MNQPDQSLQITSIHSNRLNIRDKLALTLTGLGFMALLGAAFGTGNVDPLMFLVVSIGLISIGALLYFRRYLLRPAGLNNSQVLNTNITNRGAWGWMLGIVLTGFYVMVYWYPQTLEGLIRMFDPLSRLLRGTGSDQWFLYGSFYTIAVLLMGIRAIYRYRHSRYQLIRTSSVMFFQLGFAFLLPAILIAMNKPEFYFTYFWPLKPEYLYPSTVFSIAGSTAGIGYFMIIWGVIMTIIATPVLTYFFGKRWYCSWVCGCGGLAETAGDPFRHLSNKSLKAWKVERIMVHSVLVIVTLGTLLLWVNSWRGGALLGDLSHSYSRWYGFLIGGIFAGVIGVGFYPIMGSRVWCRYGCPMAAILGIFQRFLSRFRITTNGGQCISCGNCSKYCEMGIDVQAYAQKGKNIVRASCVGCGMCEAVCPRGVLHLENRNYTTGRPVIRISRGRVRVDDRV